MAKRQLLERFRDSAWDREATGVCRDAVVGGVGDDIVREIWAGAVR